MKQGNNITLKKHLLFVLLSLWLVSCYNDNPVIVDPIPEQEESPSAKDNQPWPLTQYMDAANYRPGDDFFMYCNGSYWKNTSLGDNQLICVLPGLCRILQVEIRFRLLYAGAPRCPRLSVSPCKWCHDEHRPLV